MPFRLIHQSGAIIHDDRACLELNAITRDAVERITVDEAVEEINGGNARPCQSCIGRRPPVAEGQNG